MLVTARRAPLAVPKAPVRDGTRALSDRSLDYPPQSLQSNGILANMWRIDVNAETREYLGTAGMTATTSAERDRSGEECKRAESGLKVR